MAFSGALKITDLSDFIAPSQACVISLDTVKKEVAIADLVQVCPAYTSDTVCYKAWVYIICSGLYSRPWPAYAQMEKAWILW